MSKLKKLNDALYEWDKYDYNEPASVEIVFFHGVALQNDLEELFETTWMTSSGSEFWPAAWLPMVRDAPRARIFSVKYDSSIKKSHDHGRYSMRTVVEYLAVNLIELGEIGQRGVPVILVGHDLGGLVIKALCRHLLTEKQISGGSPSASTSSARHMEYGQFLKNVAGIFYFATSHMGLEMARDDSTLDGLLVQHLQTHDAETSQINNDFRRLRRWNNWAARGLGSANEDTEVFLHVNEASMRYDVDEFLMVSETVESITKPISEESSTFQFFSQSVKDFVAAWNKSNLRFTESPLKNTVGLEKIVEDILLDFSRQQEKGAGTSAVVLHGMGGIGKSTLGVALFRTLQQRFAMNSSCLVDRDATGQSPSTVSQLQQQIMQTFQFTPSLEIRTSERPNQRALLMECYREKRTPILLFIDNVLDEDELSELLPEDVRESFQNGSHLIVTTRNARVCSRLSRTMGLEHALSHEVKELDAETAQRLLCRRAFGYRDVEVPLDRLPVPKHEMEQVLEACGGLPLALEVVGQYLRDDKSVDAKCGWGMVWKEAVNSLKAWESITGVDQSRLQLCLEFSYQKLSPGLQQVFLDLVFCFNGSPWRELHVLYGDKLKKLKQRALIKKGTATTEGQEYTYVKIHALVFAMGQKMGTMAHTHFKFEVIDGDDVDLRGIVSHQQHHGGSRIVLVLDGRSGQRSLVPSFRFLPGNGCLALQEKFKRVQPPALPKDCMKSFAKLLRILVLKNIRLQEHWSGDDLPRGLVCLVCERSTVPFSNFWSSVAKGEVSSHEEFSNLSALKLVDVISTMEKSSTYSFGAEVVRVRLESPFINTLQFAPGRSKLEELAVISGRNFHIRNANKTEFPSLRKLCLQNINELRELPPVLFKMQGLESLSIQDCRRLHQLPTNLDELKNLRYLDVRLQNLSEIPESVCNMASLVSLTLKNCSLLEQLPVGIGRIPTLRLVAVKECPKLEGISESLGSTFTNYEARHVQVTSFDNEAKESVREPVLLQTVHCDWTFFTHTSAQDLRKLLKEAGIGRQLQPVTPTSMDTIRQIAISLLVDSSRYSGKYEHLQDLQEIVTAMKELLERCSEERRNRGVEDEVLIALVENANTLRKILSNLKKTENDRRRHITFEMVKFHLIYLVPLSFILNLSCMALFKLKIGKSFELLIVVILNGVMGVVLYSKFAVQITSPGRYFLFTYLCSSLVSFVVYFGLGRFIHLIVELV